MDKKKDLLYVISRLWGSERISNTSSLATVQYMIYSEL